MEINTNISLYDHFFFKNYTYFKDLGWFSTSIEFFIPIDLDLFWFLILNNLSFYLLIILLIKKFKFEKRYCQKIFLY